jgi:hypothetical protein
MRTAAVIATLLALLAAAGAVSLYMWRELEGTVIGTHGLIALTLGVVVTLLVGGGLVYLTLVSDRRGFDERAGKD